MAKKKLTFMGLELDPKEEEDFKKKLKKKDLFGKQVVRTLVRKWLADE